MTTPRPVQKFMREAEMTEDEVREYVLDQLVFYNTIPRTRSSTEEQWIAFKLGCSSTGALLAITWARS